MQAERAKMRQAQAGVQDFGIVFKTNWRRKIRFIVIAFDKIEHGPGEPDTRRWGQVVPGG